MQLRLPVFLVVALAGVLACAAPNDPEGEKGGLGGDTTPSARPRQQEPDRDSDRSRPLVTERGFGPHQAGGVSSGAVERDTGLDLSPRPMTDICSVAWDNRAGLGVTIDDETLVLAFMVRTAEHRTYGDVGVGSSIDEIRREFGEAVVVLGDPVAPGSGPSVEVAPGGSRADNTLGLHFRTGTDGRVTEYRVGLRPWIGYAEYCFS
ncbi:hypothetical protein [Micromonospora sp. NPDC023633]|uniref:hypothetical protein n=1 Tax=Micromonospora sp. NPDC023633 TaxID=3154320 RepID=UPI0033C343C0